MILLHEVLGCISPEIDTTDEQERVCIEHYLMGGFHSRIMESERQAFREWLHEREWQAVMQPPAVLADRSPERQLDLLESLT